MDTSLNLVDFSFWTRSFQAERWSCVCHVQFSSCLETEIETGKGRHLSIKGREKPGDGLKRVLDVRTSCCEEVRDISTVARCDLRRSSNNVGNTRYGEGMVRDQPDENKIPRPHMMDG
jgi:hypothetical protein